MKKTIISFLVFIGMFSYSFAGERDYLFSLTSVEGHNGNTGWVMKKADEVRLPAEKISQPGLDVKGWMPAIVPGTVLNSLVHNGIYPEPYYGLNNKISSGIIPDISTAGRDFYTYWFRAEFCGVSKGNNEKIWMQIDGINYRAEFWLNGKMVSFISGMFKQEIIDVTDYIRTDSNTLAVKVYPVDEPGGPRKGNEKSFGAVGEFRNGGNGEIGKNVTMLMTVGWDFSFLDGIRDRNTGIWKDIYFFRTGSVCLNHPFVKSKLNTPNYDRAEESISVEVFNPGFRTQKVRIIGSIPEAGIDFEKTISVPRGMSKTAEFTPDDFPCLRIDNPRLWWPKNKGKAELYTLSLKAVQENTVLDSISTRFGIREITSDTNTPDKSRTFRVNGKPIFIRGTNWIPENMLRISDKRTEAELRYSSQAGINLIRLWGGGITESDRFYELCDELGIMVWTEFWMTGDTKHPVDRGLYLQNVESTVKRIRNHPSLAYYVCSNESTEMSGIRELLASIDGTRGYQMQSECDGVHDGSPYKTVNPMRHYENTASDRGSRVDGFNPEYGAPCLPTVECLREMMPEKDLWPINKEVWDYSDGNGFHQMSTLYKNLVDQYGESETIDEYAMKAQFVGAMLYKSIWEVWNYNKLSYGDRYTSGLLFWYHNSAIRQVCGRMWDWSLEPTAALYATANACEPLHPQFDYLKNTVSVVNDYPEEFSGLKVCAEIWDINSRKIKTYSSAVELPADGVANDVLKITFPENISPVHFLKLRLLDATGKEVGSNFYWRSTNEYKGKKTLTGPATAGFESISELGKAKVSIKHNIKRQNGKDVINVLLKNTGNTIAFFTQIQLLDSDGKPVRPSFYSDNFFSMLPGETREVTIETEELAGEGNSLVLKGYNIQKKSNYLFLK